MKLTDLDPQWIVRDGKRIGFTFKSPTKPENRQSCFDAATFETMTVTPSLDGSAGGLWHGFITNGVIVGGM